MITQELLVLCLHTIHMPLSAALEKQIPEKVELS